VAVEAEEELLRAEPAEDLAVEVAMRHRCTQLLEVPQRERRCQLPNLGDRLEELAADAELADLQRRAGHADPRERAHHVRVMRQLGLPGYL